MTRKKQFVAPRVVQQVPVLLEEDLLQGSTKYNMTVITMGQEVENYELEDESSGYTIDLY